eukprot:TCONS_00022497-protein
MKTRFTTIDIKAALAEINKSDAIGLRVMNVYDIDNRTYLVRLVHGDTKIVILIESGNRIHLTEYDWPKNMMPSGFSMKCRKHLRGRRLAAVNQIGIDRIVDFTFGYDEAAYHLIVELYDRGNIILTDHEYKILQLLRVRADTDKDVKFAVREQYPVDLAKQHEGVPNEEKIQTILKEAKPGENLKRILNPNFVYGPAVLEHTLLSVGLKPNAKVPQQLNPEDSEVINKISNALHNSENILQSIQDDPKGYIIQRAEKKAKSDGDSDDKLLTYAEFHPYFYEQHQKSPNLEFPSFNKSVDEFFSKLESQKIDMKAMNAEKSALKRLENVKDDHKKRLEALKSSQDLDTTKAELIEMNLPLVEQAIATINSAIANQIDWEEIEDIVKEAQSQHDPIASSIKSLKLNVNQIVLSLRNFYDEDSDSDDESEDDGENKNLKKSSSPKTIEINIDLGLSAFANARSFHNKRRQAASKEEKTIQASKKALRSAEQKTKETLKEVQTAKMISKTRKANWFEKFYWFISSENYLVVGGRDQQQNELLVKRYLRAGDLYVHADLHGASSVIIINHGKGDIPPKTLNEAGTMAICYSAAWDARVVTSAWWVHHNQVSKTAPSGEYLTTGSFMIRGKKNYLPPSHLVMGFSVMFKLEESSIPNHVNDRRVRTIEDDVASQVSEADTGTIDEEQEIPLVNEDPDEEVLSPVSEETIKTDMEKCDIKEEETDNIEKDSLPHVENIVEIENNEAKNVSNSENVASDENEDHKDRDDDIEKEDKENNEKEQIQEGEGVTNIEQEVEKSTAETKEDDIDEDEDFEYPDTNIELQYMGGEKFQLQRGESTYSNEGSKSENTGEEAKNENRKPKLSKKQRRYVTPFYFEDTRFFYKNILFKNIHDETSQKFKNVLRKSPSWNLATEAKNAIFRAFSIISC